MEKTLKVIAVCLCRVHSI